MKLFKRKILDFFSFFEREGIFYKWKLHFYCGIIVPQHSFSGGEHSSINYVARESWMKLIFLFVCAENLFRCQLGTLQLNLQTSLPCERLEAPSRAELSSASASARAWAPMLDPFLIKLNCKQSHSPPFLSGMLLTRSWGFAHYIAHRHHANNTLPHTET